MLNNQKICAIVPAAGIGSRMKSDRPKQYMKINGMTVLEHTVMRLLNHSDIDHIVIAINEHDPYFSTLSLNRDPRISVVNGGKERSDSVLCALKYLQTALNYDWVMVHDAARPCLQGDDIDKLITAARSHSVGAILATPVRDTMKRGNGLQHNVIDHTVSRENLWHALTPQMFPLKSLIKNLTLTWERGDVITDEASCFEANNLMPMLVHGRADNIKITQPEDLALAAFHLNLSDKKER
ncbi:MAG: 2-C-methyl-D-erythritol 4-phosphate cytidylyltransferase [Aliivibrio sp.]|uniref:2-C-methyl-D-erythritol 4-phosphate cytidylyltransferase n=1 Tax=Aliivibrio sp. TaxID=1872443 RepID=UPI001A61191A|nr:2-C-methyl-D-erythritol 4-phosphate cytidylyltransferase [Aliivibrio sp.]